MDDSSHRRSLSGLIQFLSPNNETDAAVDITADDSDQKEQLAAASPQNSYNYGSLGSLTLVTSKSIVDATLNQNSNSDLGNILEDEELHAPLVDAHHGGEDNATEFDEEIGTSDDSFRAYCNLQNDDGDEELDAKLSNITSAGFHLGFSTGMSSRNIMVHERNSPSFFKHGQEYELVPTQLKNNVRMIEDVNLIDGSKGRLYLAKYSFFNNCHDLKFAMTVQPDIYEKIMTEVNDAFNVPCGLYFCCHGGDGAHTGVSHSDFVDIKLAWFFFVMVIGLLLAVEFFVED